MKIYYRYLYNIPKRTDILVIDDNEFDLIRIEEIVYSSCSSIQLFKAFNGVEGIKILEDLYSNNTLPRMIISDINMPLMDGFEFYSTIKKDIRFSSIKTVLFTTSVLSKKMFLEKGMIVYTKPFDVVEFENTVLEIVGEINDSSQDN